MALFFFILFNFVLFFLLERTKTQLMCCFPWDFNVDQLKLTLLQSTLYVGCRCRLSVAHSLVISLPEEVPPCHVLTGMGYLTSLQQLVAFNRNLICGEHLSTGENLYALFIH